MAATPLAERSLSLKVLGAGFIALMIFFVWLTYAFFDKQFVDSDMVTLETSQSGQNLSNNADVKLRGMIVGSVRSIEPADGGVRLELALDPDRIDRIPRDVTAEIIPKTLFGEKYVSLLAAEGTGPESESLQAGDSITQAEVPIEVEQLLNNLYPLLEAVEPAELSYTLTAVSQALEGRGEQLGDTLVTLNDYLTELNPDVPTLVDDVVKLGEVSDGYAAQMPTIGRLLRNTVTTGNTVVAKRAELAAFFDEGTRLATTLTDFVDANGDDLEVLADQGRQILDVSATYSSIFPCFLQGMVESIPRLDSVLRNRTVHIDLKTLDEQPTAYEPGENATIPEQARIDATPQADPDVTPGERPEPTSSESTLGDTCQRLTEYSASGDETNPFSAEDPYPGPSAEVYRLIGLTSDHNGKFTAEGEDNVFERSAAASLEDSGFGSSGLRDVDSAEQRQQVRELAAAMSGVEADDVPDAASLLLSPVLRGAEVSAP